MGVAITFFTRQGCHLCDSALFALRQALSGVPHDLRLVDIDVDRTHFDQYDHHVPVVWVNGGEVCRHRLDRERLLMAMDAQRSADSAKEPEQGCEP